MFNFFLFFLHRQSSSLNEQFTNACLYVDKLADQNQMGAMFKTRFSRLPPDLQKQVEVSWVNKGFTRDKYAISVIQLMSQKYVYMTPNSQCKFCLNVIEYSLI